LFVSFFFSDSRAGVIALNQRQSTQRLDTKTVDAGGLLQLRPLNRNFSPISSNFVSHPVPRGFRFLGTMQD
jgi:hypothetical protein